jgi:hypothetical protein
VIEDHLASSEPGRQRPSQRIRQRAGDLAQQLLDSLNPAPSDDVRLTLTSQIARLVDGYDQKAADEMRLGTAASGSS